MQVSPKANAETKHAKETETESHHALAENDQPVPHKGNASTELILVMGTDLMNWVTNQYKLN